MKVFPREHLFWSLGCVLMLSALALARDDDKAKKEEPKKPPIYDVKADARAQVSAAVAKAKRDNMRVLVMFGFETCSWCHKLHALFRENPEIRKLLANEYTLVMVATTSPHADKLIKECKAVLAKEELEKGVGYPFLAVMDDAGKIVTAQRTEPLEEGKGHDPGRVKDFLTHWTAPHVNARTVLEEALARAAKEDKRVFLHFGAPWCGWCHRLDDFMTRKEIASIIGLDYIDVKIDIDRMDNGKDVMETYCKKQGGIPWIAILDAQGKALVNSDGPKGNVGYPAEAHEIEHFMSMLKQTARKMDAGQFDQIEAALKKAKVDLGRN